MKRTLMPLLAAVAIAFTASGAASAATPQVTTSHGCPAGDVCIYNNDSWSGGITYKFRAYGIHKIYNQFGTHRVFNNQTDDAGVFLCNDAGCNDISGSLGAGAWDDWNLTPINALELFA